VYPVDNTTFGFDDYGSIVQTLPVPQAISNTKYCKMGYSETNFYIPGEGAGGFSVWTDSVGPCHVVLVHGRPRGGLGSIGIAHVSGDHQTICQNAEKLLVEMEKTQDCEVFIIGGDQEGVSQGYTFDASSIPSALQGKVKLVVTPASIDGFIKVELTGARKINITEHT
jgi:hypothetical protein